MQDWKLRVAILDIDDIRIFLSHIRKSGITIHQCVQSYRTIQMLKQLGVDEDDNDDEDQAEQRADKDKEIQDDHALLRKHNPCIQYEKQSPADFKIYNSKNQFKLAKENYYPSIKMYQFSYFVEEIYNDCKRHEIKPSIIIAWIEDLFNFYSIKKNIFLNESTYEHLNTDMKNNIVVGYPSSRQNEKYDNEIPFVSQVSNFIKAKKKNIDILQDKKNSIETEITVLEKQRIERVSELNKAIEKQKKTYSYFEWYNKLGQYLSEKYNILLEQEIELFANALQDFKQYHFAATKILSEYNVISSLRKERKQIQDELQQNILTRDNILKEITYLEDQSNYYIQTINIYSELHKEGLGLKELKQLNYIVMESASANNLEVKDAIKSFLKDVEDNYDNKLGFEKKINELKTEMEKLKEQVPEYKSYLRFQGIVAPTLIHLSTSGVTPEDIIGMNHLVLEFMNRDFLSNRLNKNDQSLDIKTNQSITKSQYRNLFTEKLKELKNINLEIDKQAVNQNSLMLKLKDLERKKQEMEQNYARSISLLNYIYLQISNAIEIAKQIDEGINRKIMMSSRFSPIFVSINITENGDDKGKGEHTT